MFRKKYTKWEKTLICLGLFLLLIVLFKKQQPIREGFAQRKRYTLKKNKDLFDDFYVPIYDQLMKNGHELDQQPWEYFFHQSPKPMVNDKLSNKVLQEYLSLAELNKKAKKTRGYI